MKRLFFLLARDRRNQQIAGFTLLELIVTVTLIGILTGAFLFVINTSNWRRQRVNAVAKELAGWIEEVMAYSMRENAQCVIEIIPGTRQVGDPAARIQVANQVDCPVREPEFLVPGLVDDGSVFDIRVFPAGSPIAYTPRGTVTNPDNTQVVIALQPDGPARCVRVSATLGLISIGRNDGATTAAAECLQDDFVDLI